ncbi:uncharacterized protein [Choristoneura fumiferana]|uniref:uncharacterized protein n=1 Tax=Choristoneura fumiferana TaxID=7141 RepID=UPI003D156C6C
MEEDERRLSFPPPAPLNSPGEEIDGSRLLGEIVRTLEATNPEAAAPLVASQSRDALDQESDRPRREELHIPLEGVTFSGDAAAKAGRAEPRTAVTPLTRVPVRRVCSRGPHIAPGRDEPRAAVTPFTRESARRAGSRGAQLVREFGFMPRRRLSVEDGARLPRKYEPFPPKLYGRPLEEIDNFIYDETFCVVSKRFRKNYIHRFTATRSLFWWSPWSPWRRACVYLSTNQYFDYFVMATILLNCVFLAMSETVEEADIPRFYTRTKINIEIPISNKYTFCVVSKRFRKNYIHRFTATRSLFWWSPWSPWRRACVYLSTNQYFDYFVMATILLNCVFLAMSETVEEAEYIFLAIYTAEMIIKCIAKGFILNKYTYLRNPWNWLDFVVITSGYATIGMDVGNLAGLRTFRVLRALKTVSIMPVNYM